MGINVIKKFVFVVLAIAFFCMADNKLVYAASYVMVCGETNISDDSDMEKSAIEDAKKKAVNKVLSKLIQPDMQQGSIYRKILEDYSCFVEGKVQVVKKEKIKNKMAIFCKVPLNLNSIQQSLRLNVRNEQLSENNQFDEVFFLIRVLGNFDLSQNQTIQTRVLNYYKDAFQLAGFNKGTDDDLEFKATNTYAKLPFDQYMNNIMNDVKNNVSISTAVIGEIVLPDTIKVQDGFNAKAECRVIVIHNESDGNIRTLGQFNDFYVLRRENKTEAENLVLQKAAYNSSKYLSNITLEYWNSLK